MVRADMNSLIEQGFDAQFHILEHLTEAMEEEGQDEVQGFSRSDFIGVDAEDFSHDNAGDSHERQEAGRRRKGKVEGQRPLPV